MNLKKRNFFLKEEDDANASRLLSPCFEISLRFVFNRFFVGIAEEVGIMMMLSKVIEVKKNLRLFPKKGCIMN